MTYADFLKGMNDATEIRKKEAKKWLRQKAIEILEKEINTCDTLKEIQEYMIEKDKQDERWQSLTEDGRQARIASYKELLKLQKEEADSYLITIEDLEKLYGKHNLNPEPPTPKTWEDVEKEYPDLAENLYKGIQRLAGVYENCGISLLVKCDATLKIAKLIELGYGGMVSEKEWQDEDIRKFSIVRFQGNLSYAEGRGAYEFVSFHTPEQRAEFMSYESNSRLVEQYFLM